jgi:adenylate cyclase
MRSKKVRLLKYAIPLSAGLIFGVLSLVPAWRTLERAVYDFFLHIKPQPPLVDDLYLLNIDEAAIQHVGMWPWPRSYIADGLVSLRELGASQAVFDIEYINKSASGIDQGYLKNELKSEFDLSFGDMMGGWADLVNPWPTGPSTRRGRSGTPRTS